MAISHVKTDNVADATGTVTIWWGTSTSALSATDLVRPSDWNSAHNEYRSLGGNTLLSSTASGTNLSYLASGPSLSLVGSSDSVVFSTPPHISSFANFAAINATQTMTLNAASVSHAVAFFLPQPGSFSYIRIPALMTTNSTTIATSNASRNVSGQVLSTWNAVVYSLGTGASSNSLQSVAKGQGFWTQLNSLSITGAGTQYSVTLSFAYVKEGAASNLTTQYSISNTNYSLTTNQIGTLFSSLRWIDIPFAASLSAGPYWLVFGYSSSAATNSAGNWSNCYGGRYSNHYGVSQANSWWEEMGNTAGSSGGYLMAGSFSTAGGGTTASLDLSNISSSASNVMPYFQMLRQA